MKNATPKSWNESLAKRKWELLRETDNPNQMAIIFTEMVTEALDECAPLRTFTIKPGYMPGLTEEAKKLIKEREIKQERT